YPKSWAEIAGRPPQPLEAMLAIMPAHVQERWFARLWLLKRVVFAVLSVFWLVSGIVGFVRQDAAADILISRGLSGAHALGMVFAGSDMCDDLGPTGSLRDQHEERYAGTGAEQHAGADHVQPPQYVGPETCWRARWDCRSAKAGSCFRCCFMPLLAPSGCRWSGSRCACAIWRGKPCRKIPLCPRRRGASLASGSPAVFRPLPQCLRSSV